MEEEKKLNDFARKLAYWIRATGHHTREFNWTDTDGGEGKVAEGDR